MTGAGAVLRPWPCRGVARRAAEPRPARAGLFLPLLSSAGAGHRLRGGVGKERQHGRGAHRPGTGHVFIPLPACRHPPSTGSQDPGLRSALDSRGHQASFCATPAVAGNGGLSHFVLGHPITATVLAEGPSGHSEPQAAVLLPVNHCGRRRGECPRDLKPGQGACSAGLTRCQPLASVQERLEKWLFRAGVCLSARFTGKCVLCQSWTSWNWGIVTVLDPKARRDSTVTTQA